MIKYLKLEGKEVVECSLDEHNQLLKDNPDYYQVRRTHFDNGTLVSTVLLMIDHHGQNFETMLFAEDDEDNQMVHRSKTYDDAVVTHWDFVREYTARTGAREVAESSFDFMEELKRL